MKIYANDQYLGEVDQEVELGPLLQIDGVYYRWCSLDIKNGILNVDRIEHCDSLPKEDSTYANDYLVCPYCGYEDLDSSELPEEDDEYECPQCGSTLKYVKNIRVDFDCELVAERDPLEIELK